MLPESSHVETGWGGVVTRYVPDRSIFTNNRPAGLRKHLNFRNYYVDHSAKFQGCVIISWILHWMQNFLTAFFTSFDLPSFLVVEKTLQNTCKDRIPSKNLFRCGRRFAFVQSLWFSRFSKPNFKQFSYFYYLEVKLVRPKKSMYKDLLIARHYLILWLSTTCAPTVGHIP